MPRYFFNTRFGDEVISDPDGELLRDPDQAWEIARAMIRELLKLEGAQGDLLNAILEVTDDARRNRAGVSVRRGDPRHTGRAGHQALTQQLSFPMIPIACRRENIGHCGAGTPPVRASQRTRLPQR